MRVSVWRKNVSRLRRSQSRSFGEESAMAQRCRVESGLRGWRRRGGLATCHLSLATVLGLRHRSDYGAQKGVHIVGRLENRSDIRFEDNGYYALRHLLCKAIRLSQAVIEPVLLPHSVP